MRSGKHLTNEEAEELMKLVAATRKSARNIADKYSLDRNIITRHVANMIKITVDADEFVEKVFADKENNVKTNAEKIRAMSDEELMEFLIEYDMSPECKQTKRDNWLKWLKSKSE